jgi:general secretion pathway protein D
VTLDVDPVVGPNGFTIDLTLTPEVVEFEGFINYGNPITSGAIDGLGRPTQVVITENRIEMPIFSTRRVKTAVTVWDGQTVAIGGLIREDVQNVEDKVPLLGDAPLIGRLFKTKAEDRFKRNLMVFVTARLIDPSGKPVNSIAGETFGGAGMFTTPVAADPAAPGGATLQDNPIFSGADGLPTL